MKIIYFLIITFFIQNKAITAELIEPVYDEERKMYNYKEVSRYAVCAFNRTKNDQSFRLKAAKQIIEASKNYEDDYARLNLINPMVLSDHIEASLLAVEEVKVYMKMSKSFWSNNLSFLHRFPGFDLNDDESATKKIHKLMDIIELIGSDREIASEPRYTLISGLDFIKYCISNSQKTAEEQIRDYEFGIRNTAELKLKYRTKFREDVAKVLIRSDEIKERIK